MLRGGGEAGLVLRGGGGEVSEVRVVCCVVVVVKCECCVTQWSDGSRVLHSVVIADVCLLRSGVIAGVCSIAAVECCVGVSVWSCASRGLCGVGQEELVLLLEALPGELHPPSDVFAYFYSVYQQANKGSVAPSYI